MIIHGYSEEELKKLSNTGVIFKKMNTDNLIEVYYAPSDSYELLDPKTNQFYNRSGQKLRDPEEYDQDSEGYTPFGDE